MGQIRPFSQCQHLRSDIEDIFFHSSVRKIFETPQEREKFRYKWLDVYLDHKPEKTLVSVNPQGHALGYLASWPDSLVRMDLFQDIPYYHMLSNFYHEYPAHLHINVHENARNSGIGQILMQAFFDLCASEAIQGAHLVTTAQARNRNFYQKCGFEPIHLFAYQGTDLLLLGKRLSH